MVPFVDISKHQGPVDFAKMTANHVEGVFIRAGNGTRPDPMFLPHLVGARAAGLKVGVYWFCNPKVSTGIDQGQRLAAAHLVAKGDVRPMLDVEDYTAESGPTGQLPADQYAVWLRGMVAEVARTRTPIIYTNRAYWGAHVQATDFGHLDLICARYPFYSPTECAAHVPPLDARDWDEWIMAETPKRPQVPDGWDTWNAWQFSAGYNGRGHAYGATSADMDLNIARDDAWARWLDRAPVEPPIEIIPPITPPQEADMPRFIQPADGDTAVFITDGLTATWVPNSQILSHAVADAFTVDGTRHPVHRDTLKLLRLWGPAPTYAAGYTGPRSTAADFGSAA